MSIIPKNQLSVFDSNNNAKQVYIYIYVIISDCWNSAAAGHHSDNLLTDRYIAVASALRQPVMVSIIASYACMYGWMDGWGLDNRE